MGRKIKDRSHIPEVGDYVKITKEGSTNFGLTGILREEKPVKRFTVTFDEENRPDERYYEIGDFSIIKKQVGF